MTMAQPIPIHAAPQQLWYDRAQFLRNLYAGPLNNLDRRNSHLRNLMHSLTACFGGSIGCDLPGMDCVADRCKLGHGGRLCTPEGTQMSGILIAGAIVAAGLLIYLLVALLHPEKFS
jgi:K+-transporting ATPase KdpF subunit